MVMTCPVEYRFLPKSNSARPAKSYRIGLVDFREGGQLSTEFGKRGFVTYLNRSKVKLQKKIGAIARD
jgi:hypothetical protein